ncbi:MAG: hypothetical protein ACLUHL_09450 [Dysosmobacter welbionis]
MSFEAEVIPLFIGGVIAVSAIEFFLGWRSLRHRKDLRGLFAGHVVAMLLGFFFLIRSLFANWLGLSLGIASISNSANIGLFGLCWAVSAICVAVMIPVWLHPDNDHFVRGSGCQQAPAFLSTDLP